MGDWEKLQTLIISEAQRVILPNLDPSDKKLQTVFHNHLYGTSGPTSIQRNLSRDEFYFSKIFKGFNEIFKSMESLQDVEVYISSFPYKNKTINKSDFLDYHLVHYFNEIYILQERLCSYLRTIGRCFRNDIRHAEILSITRPLFKIVKNSLLKAIEIRGKHIHESRFVDKDIDRIRIMELLYISDDEKITKFFDSSIRDTFSQIRKKWKNTLKGSNENLRKLLDKYANGIVKILLTEENELIYPRHRNAA